jgi:hypothetical protein
VGIFVTFGRAVYTVAAIEMLLPYSIPDLLALTSPCKRSDNSLPSSVAPTGSGGSFHGV